MQLLVNNLPTKGINYKFVGVQIKPMFYGQILEYMENVPKGDLEKFYFDYCLMKEDDPNIENLYVPDFEFCRYYKKAITISKDEAYTTSFRCPECGTKFYSKVTIRDIKFSSIDTNIIEGRCIELGGKYYDIKLPTVKEFLNVLRNYRRYKKLSDIRLIQSISIFPEAVKYPNKYESLVVNAQYADIAALTMLHSLYFDPIEPLVVYCPNCNEGIVEPKNMRGMEVGIDSLASNFFRDILINNKFDKSKIFSREVRRSDEHRSLHPGNPKSN